MSEQKMIIVNAECDFIVKDYEAIQALKACEERAEKMVPPWVRGKLNQNLNSKLDEKWRIDEDKGGYLFNTTYYKDKDKIGYGYYFYIEELTLEEFAAESEDNGCWVCLRCDFSRKKKQEWKDWNNDVTTKIEKNKSKLAKCGYNVFLDDEEGYLVAKWLLKDLNIKALAEDPEDSINKTADSVIKFVNDMLKYLVALPEE